MAKYTVEIAEMLSAYASLLDVETDEKSVIITPPNESAITFSVSEFNFYKVNQPQFLIKHLATNFINYHLEPLDFNATTDTQLNKSLLDKFYQAFLSEFYDYEIAFENPLNWWRKMYNYLLKYLPLYEQIAKNLIIDKAQFITNTSHSDLKGLTASTGNTTSNSKTIGANADVPQNELNFEIETDDPLKAYNFHYASGVSGSHATDDTQAKSNVDNTTSQDTSARNATIASLVNELFVFSDGIYTDFFEKARQEGLFLMIH